MSQTNNLPDCKLIQQLVQRSSERTDTDFDFLGQLEALRQRVSAEVSYIKVLFPEYTPHDEKHHLEPLFHFAEKILGDQVLESMRSCELFVLAAALYGHDWGMAVSDAAREYITVDQPPADKDSNDMGLLPDERERFGAFLSAEFGTTEETKDSIEVTDDIWREYVRRTHAARSGERIRRFFEQIDGGVADATSSACEGHWLKFEDLQDHKRFPPDFPILGETANLRALAIYVRLIDLFDMTANRTPYVLWKYVAPREGRSKMEWAKHRAVHTVSFQDYQDGRKIIVQGSTHDHEVYAALEDLRIYCDEQLRGSKDVLALMNDDRHTLNIHHVEWRVAARGFQPTLIRFEFDREKMFEILGTEIYQGDPYVFLRELLQNSIDAIRMRREILERNKLSPGALGVIRVDVEHKENGDADVVWRDNGIGMDDYTIRNYLAVAGKSYYHSEDFARQKLKMDPISRFGIGLLSCFMVADNIEIETRRDPYLPPQGQPLRVSIPDAQRYFRIERLVEESSEVGTTVTVHIRGSKLPKDKETGETRILDVTEYLSIIAGFVEFPIVVNEGDRKTVIVDPYQNVEDVQERFGDDYTIHQLDLDEPWTNRIVPQDREIAQNVFREDRFDIPADLTLPGFQGVLALIVPKSENIDVATDTYSGYQVIGQNRRQSHLVRWSEPKSDTINQKLDSRSARINRRFAVYLDGILLSGFSEQNMSLAQKQRSDSERFRLLVNIPKMACPLIDVARTTVMETEKHPLLKVMEAFGANVLRTAQENILSDEPADCLFHLSRVVAYYGLECDKALHSLPQVSWPLLCLAPDGTVTARVLGDYAEHAVVASPYACSRAVADATHARWVGGHGYDGPLSSYRGEYSVVLYLTEIGKGLYSRTVEAMVRLTRHALKITHELDSLMYVQPPWDSGPPMTQEIWERRSETTMSEDAESILRSIATGALPARACDVRLLKPFKYLFELARFSPPYEDRMVYCQDWLNLDDPRVQRICRIAASLSLSDSFRAIGPREHGELSDALNDYLHGLFYLKSNEVCDRLRMKLVQAGLTDLSTGDYGVTEEDYVPGSAKVNETYIYTRLDGLSTPKPFGMPLQ